MCARLDETAQILVECVVTGAVGLGNFALSSDSQFRSSWRGKWGQRNGPGVELQVKVTVTVPRCVQTEMTSPDSFCRRLGDFSRPCKTDNGMILPVVVGWSLFFCDLLLSLALISTTLP